MNTLYLMLYCCDRCCTIHILCVWQLGLFYCIRYVVHTVGVRSFVFTNSRSCFRVLWIAFIHPGKQLNPALPAYNTTFATSLLPCAFVCCSPCLRPSSPSTAYITTNIYTTPRQPRFSARAARRECTCHCQSPSPWRRRYGPRTGFSRQTISLPRRSRWGSWLASLSFRSLSGKSQVSCGCGAGLLCLSNLVIFFCSSVSLGEV